MTPPEADTLTRPMTETQRDTAVGAGIGAVTGAVIAIFSLTWF